MKRMTRAAIVEGGGQIYLEEYDKAVQGLDLSDYEERFQKDLMAWRTDQLADPLNDMMMFGLPMEELDAKLAQLGIDPSAFAPVMGPKHERRPCGLYDAMLRPIAPYGIRSEEPTAPETDLAWPAGGIGLNKKRCEGSVMEIDYRAIDDLLCDNLSKSSFVQFHLSPQKARQ